MKYKPNYLCDLHCHTNLSDGMDTPKEFIDRAASFGMKVIAMTDHDKNPPSTVDVNGLMVDINKYAEERGLILLRGIEFSCDTTTEDVHIIAFGCDFSDERFLKLERKTSISKISAYKELVNRFNNAGFKISWEEVLNNNGNPIEAKSVQKKLIFQLIADKGYTKSWKDAKIMTQTNKEFEVLRIKPECKEIIKLIHDTNGVSILAHPHLFNHKTIKRKAYIENLIALGLDGIEASYAYSKTNYHGILSDKQIKNEIVSEYKKRGLFISGGSDYHGE